jgi:hypothetical protein
MSIAIKEMNRVELVNLDRRAHILKGLSIAELETLEILSDEKAFRCIDQSLNELERGEGIQIEKSIM